MLLDFVVWCLVIKIISFDQLCYMRNQLDVQVFTKFLLMQLSLDSVVLDITRTPENVGQMSIVGLVFAYSVCHACASYWHCPTKMIIWSWKKNCKDTPKAYTNCHFLSSGSVCFCHSILESNITSSMRVIFTEWKIV